MPLFRSEPRGIGRGEVAESRVEVPFFAAFMALCALVLLVVHTYLQNDALTIALAVSMFVFGLTVVRVELGVAILAISMLLSPEVDFGSSISGEHSLEMRYDDILIMVIFLGVLVRSAFERRQSLWRPSPVNLGIALYMLICFVSTLLALRANLLAWDKRSAFFVILKMIEFYMIFFMVGNAVHNLREVRFQLRVFFLVALVVCAYCLFTMNTQQRVGTPFEARGAEPNTLGGYLMIVMCIAVGLLSQAPRNGLRLLFIFITAMAFLPFLFTLSRASYVALLVALLSLGILGRKLYVVVAVALVLILSPILMPQHVKERVNYTFQEGTGERVVIAGRDTGLQVDKSTHERFYVWRKVWYILHVAPWFGGGVAWETVLDSQYARVIMETGLFGLVAFLFLQYRLIRTCRESFVWSRDWMARGLALGAAAATIGLITHSLGTISFLIIRIMEPFWFIIALTVVARSVAIQDYAQQLSAERQAAERAAAKHANGGVPSLTPAGAPAR